MADHDTGLQWEKKTGTVGSDVFCDTAGCPDPHIVNNRYEWSDTGSPPNGGAFTDFLAKLNDPVFGTASIRSDVTGCFAGHCDWRLPIIVELTSILDCSYSPCIDPIFGPTASSFHWSASNVSGTSPHNVAWMARFGGGPASGVVKTIDLWVRAVRAGSCH